MTDLDDDEQKPVAGPADVAVPPAARVLLRVVYIMGIILVLLLVALVGGIIWKSMRKAEPKPEIPPAAINLGLPPGSEVRAAVIDGDRLVINTGREVIVVDVKKNAIVSRVVTGP